MIPRRTADKHRNGALEIGVELCTSASHIRNKQLLDAIAEQLGQEAAMRRKRTAVEKTGEFSPVFFA